MGKKSIKFLELTCSKKTIYNYECTVREYEQFHGTDIDTLVDEALQEQTDRVPYHQLSVIDRIEDFQNHLINERDLVHGTIVVMMGRIKTIYTNNRVDLPKITSINPKKTRKREYIEFKDVLTKEEIRCVLRHMNPIAQARTLVMAQGGLSNAECELLTLTAFIEETKKYHQCDDTISALKWLASDKHPIIWVTKMIRQKTKKPYYALIGAEAVNKIAEAKLYELELPKNKGRIPEKLLNCHIASFGRTCRVVNKKCGLGLVAEESKLRPHNLRRFNATYIKGGVVSYEENCRLSNSEIDEMQGRGKTSVQDTYIKSNPLEQKLLYAKVMNNVSLYHEYDYVLTNDDVEIFLVDQVAEKKKLIEKVKKLENQLAEKKRASENINKLRREIGDDTFKEILKGILDVS